MSAKVVVVCPNDLVIDTRGQKVATSLARFGLDVTVVARASARAPMTETVDGYHVVRVEVPAVPLARPVPKQSEALTRSAATLLAQSRTAARAAIGRGSPLRSRPRQAARAVKLRLRRSRTLAAARAAEAAERQATEGLGGPDSRAAWPTWRETLGLPIEIAEAFWPTIQALAPDVVHCHDLDGLAAAGFAHDRLRATGSDCRLVYDAHENWAGLPDLDWIPRVHGSLLGLERDYIAVADLVVTVSAEIAEVLERRYSLPARPLVLLNTPSSGRGRPAGRSLRADTGVGSNVPLMVYSGSISHARRVPDLIRVLPLLPELHLAVVSVPYPHRLAPEFEALAAELGVTDRMHIVAPVPSPQVVDYLSGATFGVHPLLPGAPNHEMALPNKIFEYLHAGIPLVVSDCRTMAQFVTTNQIGRSFHFGDVDSLAAAIEEVLTGLAEGRLRPAPDLAEQYSWEAQEPALAAAYSGLVAADLTPGGRGSQ